MTNVCRQLGKRLEERLFRDWGGKPTTQLPRHRDRTIEAVTKRRYHLFLANKINEPFPSKEQEAADAVAADEIYQSGIRWLLNHTRPDDSKKFEMLFKENIAYGFRRNALGVKLVGLIIATGSVLWILVKQNVIVCRSRGFVDWFALQQLPETSMACLIVSTFMILIWVFFFTKATVRTASFSFAEMLLRACDIL